MEEKIREIIRPELKALSDKMYKKGVWLGISIGVIFASVLFIILFIFEL